MYIYKSSGSGLKVEGFGFRLKGAATLEGNVMLPKGLSEEDRYEEPRRWGIDE